MFEISHIRPLKEIILKITNTSPEGYTIRDYQTLKLKRWASLVAQAFGAPRS